MLGEVLTVTQESVAREFLARDIEGDPRRLLEEILTLPSRTGMS